MTLAIEPMISMTKEGEKTDVLADNWTVVTRDRSLSAHFEHTVVITDDGCEVLTLPADYP
jgi:methionyl aminopeptidase